MHLQLAHGADFFFSPHFFVFVLCECSEQEDEEANTGSHMKLIVDAFIQQLPNCVNRDLIDKVSTRTVHMVSRHQRHLTLVLTSFLTSAGRHGLLHEHEHQVQQEEAGASALHRPQAEVR